MLTGTFGQSERDLRVPLAKFGLALAPILIGGWFIYILLTSFPALLDRSIALPVADGSMPFLDDFIVFHSAGKHVAEIGGAVYDPATISALQAEETGQDPDDALVLPFFNPPSALLLFSLFALIPIGSAAIAWMGTSAIAAFVSTRGLVRMDALSPDARILVVLGIASWLPMYQAVVHGQMTFLLLAGFSLYCLGLLAANKEKYVVPGLLLLALKPVFLALPLLYLALRRQFRLLAAFALAEGALIIVAAMLFGWELPFDYVSLSIQAIGWDEVNGISTYGMFGWTGFWRGVLGPDAHGLQMTLTMTSALATIGAFIWVCHRGGSMRLSLAAMVLAALLISPHSYMQDLLLLTIPALLLLSDRMSAVTFAFIGFGLWFAVYFHFDTLASTGLGLANLSLILLMGFVLAQGTRIASIQLPEPARLWMRERPDSDFPSENAVKS